MKRRWLLGFALVSSLGAASASACKDDDASSASTSDGGTVDTSPAGGSAETGASDASPDTGDDAPPAVVTCSRTFGDGKSRLLPNGLAVDSNGAIILAGGLYGTADFGGGPITTAGQSDIFLSKLDNMCNFVFSNRFGDAELQAAGVVAVDSLRNIVLTGRFAGKIDFGLGPTTAPPNGQMFVTKFDPNGKAIWNHFYGQSGNQYVAAIAITNNDEIVLGGSFYGELNLGGGTLPGGSADGSDGETMYVAKLSSAGMHAWSRAFRPQQGGFHNGVANSIVASSSDIVVGGHADGTLNFDGLTLNMESGGSFLLRVNPNGTITAANGFTNTSFGVVTNEPGGALVGGRVTGVVDIGTGPLLAEPPDKYRTSLIAEMKNDLSAAQWVRAFGGLPSKDHVFALVGMAATMTEVGVSAHCFLDVDYGDQTPCSDNSNLFIRYHRDGGFGSATPHPMGLVTVSPTRQFIVAGHEGVDGGAERLTITKFDP